MGSSFIIMIPALFSCSSSLASHILTTSLLSTVDLFFDILISRKGMRFSKFRNKIVVQIANVLIFNNYICWHNLWLISNVRFLPKPFKTES